MTIDVHSHFVPKGWPDLGPGRPWLRVDSERQAMIMVGDTEFRAIRDDAWSAETRLAAMDEDGVEAQVVSPTPLFFTYEAEAREGEKICRIFNDLALEICAPAPERLIPFAQVPLQDPDAACRELDRAMAAGHRGVEIGNHLGDDDLDSEGVVAFLQHAASVGAPVFVHPWDMAESPRLNRWMARWLAGMPQETHLSIISLILGGAFDRISEDLRICFAHGGGSFAFWLGRFENAWHGRPDLIATSEHPPSHYVGRFSVDSVVFEPAALRLLVDTLGIDNVMTGSDFPYPLGERPVGAVTHRSEFLSDSEKDQVLSGNAKLWLERGPGRGALPPIHPSSAVGSSTPG